MGIGLRLCGLAAATATAVSGAVRTAPPTLPATTGPAAPVQTVPIQNGRGVIGDGDHERSHCPGDDIGDGIGDNFGDSFGDCYWCCG
jgi:hypothetical protein